MAREFVKNDVPEILDALPVGSGTSPPVGDAISAHVTGLRSKGWLVEEFVGLKELSNLRSSDVHERYGGREWVLPIPAHRMNEDGPADDFLIIAMHQDWRSWCTWTWMDFVGSEWGSKERFERIATGRFFRVFAPAADRVYDIMIFRPSGTGGPTIVSDSAFARGVERAWSSFNPPDPREWTNIFGLGLTAVERVAALRSNVGAYTALQVYAKRFAASSTFLHAEFGKRRTRDEYVLELLSKTEFVIVRTLLFTDTGRDALVSDLRAILAGADARAPGKD